MWTRLGLHTCRYSCKVLIEGALAATDALQCLHRYATKNGGSASTNIDWELRSVGAPWTSRLSTEQLSRLPRRQRRGCKWTGYDPSLYISSFLAVSLRLRHGTTRAKNPIGPVRSATRAMLITRRIYGRQRVLFLFGLSTFSARHSPRLAEPSRIPSIWTVRNPDMSCNSTYSMDLGPHVQHLSNTET